MDWKERKGYVKSVTVERWRMWSIGWSGAQSGLDIVRHYWNNVMIIPPFLMKIPRQESCAWLATTTRQHRLSTLCGRRVLAHSARLNSLCSASPWLNCKLNCILYMWRTHYLSQQFFCVNIWFVCVIVLLWASLCPSAVWHGCTQILIDWLIDWLIYMGMGRHRHFAMQDIL